MLVNGGVELSISENVRLLSNSWVKKVEFTFKLRLIPIGGGGEVNKLYTLYTSQNNGQ